MAAPTGVIRDHPCASVDNSCPAVLDARFCIKYIFLLVFNFVNQSTCQRARHGRTLLPFAVAVVVAFTCACERSSPVTDAEAEQEINYQRARKLCEASDFQAAAEFYKRALLVNAAFAKAHLELGLLCDDKLGDPISAIYHYRRYLELKPDSDKKQLVEDFIERAKLSFAAKLPQSPNMDSSELIRLQNEKAALLQENAMLRTRVAELEQAERARKLRLWSLRSQRHHLRLP